HDGRWNDPALGREHVVALFRERDEASPLRRVGQRPGGRMDRGAVWNDPALGRQRMVALIGDDQLVLHRRVGQRPGGRLDRRGPGGGRTLERKRLVGHVEWDPTVSSSRVGQWSRGCLGGGKWWNDPALGW